MVDWWSGLTLELQVFYTIGIVALGFTAIQTLLTLIGIGGDALDIDVDIPDDVHSSGIGLFSSQTIAAFFLGFGWGGVIGLKLGLHLLIAIFIAFNLGGLLMVLMYLMLVGLLSLQSSGNLDYGKAVGTTGEVYATIPANRAGRGQIQVMISGRLSTVDAETAHTSDLKPGQSIRLVEKIGNADFLVEPI
jgi:hypothetical protein